MRLRAMPLQFKSMLTVKRTVVAILILFRSDLLLYLPMLTVFRLGWVRDPLTNRSSLSLVRDSAVRAAKQNINDILNKNSIPWVTFIVMITSVALLIFKLFESSKVRSSVTSISSIDDTSGKSTDPKQTKSYKLSPKDAQVVQVCDPGVFYLYDTSGKSADPKQTKSYKLSPKDAQVVQSVILVCSIFTIARSSHL